MPYVVAFDLLEFKSEDLFVDYENTVQNFFDLEVRSYVFRIVVELFHSDETRNVESVPRLDFDVIFACELFFLRKKDFSFFFSVRH